MGAADAVGSFFGAFPVAGGFARTVRKEDDDRPTCHAIDTHV